MPDAWFTIPDDDTRIIDLHGEYVEVTRVMAGRIKIAGTQNVARLKVDGTGGLISLRPGDKYRLLDDPLEVPTEPGIYLFGDGSVLTLDGQAWVRSGTRIHSTEDVVRKLIIDGGPARRLEPVDA